MKKTNALVVMLLSLLLTFSVATTFAATSTETKEKQTLTQPPDTTVKKVPVAAIGDVVNINTADEAALVKIKGIGPKKAEAIIAYRNANGNFKSIEDLRKIKGIGPKVLEKIKPSITL